MARLRLRGGPEGNERLTSTVGLVLVGPLVVEAATTLSLSSFLPVHIFLGLLLIPPVALKLGTTGWRFASYYLRRPEYRAKGPPALGLRVLAPPLVLATVVLLGTGVAFLVVGHGGGLLLTAHAASFVVWGLLVSVHVLAYLARVARYGLADWRPGRPWAGAGVRRWAVVGALLAGVVVGLGTYSTQTGWLAHRHHRHHHELDVRARARIRAERAVSIPHTIVVDRSTARPLDRSIAGVRLGETRSSIERRIGAGSLVSVRSDTATIPAGRIERVAYDSAGLYVTYSSAGPAATQVAAGRAMVLETTWTTFKTPQGVHVGSPLAAVKAIRGVRCFGAVCQHGFVRGGGGTSFLVDPVHRKVVRIVVSFGA